MSNEAIQLAPESPEAPKVTFVDLPMSYKKGEFLLGNLPMPDDPGLAEGAKNRLKVSVRYIKDGMGRGMGRGVYLTLSGHSFDGVFETFSLYQDPSVYILLEPCKRYSSKRLEELAMGAAEARQEILQAQVAKATAYYERKGLGERVSFRDIV